MNTLSMAQVAPVVNTPATADAALARKLQAHRDYMIGFNLYADGKPDSDCRGQDQHRGWWAACSADAHVVYADHCVSRGMAIPEPDELDADEDWRIEQDTLRYGLY